LLLVWSRCLKTRHRLKLDGRRNRSSAIVLVGIAQASTADMVEQEVVEGEEESALEGLSRADGGALGAQRTDAAL